MRLTPAQAQKLADLAAGLSMPKSQLPARLYAPLQAAGAVRLIRSGASYRVRGVPGKLESFVEREWGIRDLAGLAEATPEQRSRRLLADVAGDSKALPSRPFDGIFLRSSGRCSLHGKPLGVPPPGSAMLVTRQELPGLCVTSSLLIGIENPACLWEFERALPHFPELREQDYTLILRWNWGEAWRKWLSDWSKPFCYFGDYDPAGLRIFASEVLPLQSQGRFLVPSRLRELLMTRGSRELFLKQESALHSLPRHPDVDAVAQLLKETRKGLEQEALLSAS